MYEIVVANDQERENLFAEVHIDRQPRMEVIFDDTRAAYMVTVFCGETNEWLEMPLAELFDALNQAKSALVARGYPDGHESVP